MAMTPIVPHVFELPGKTPQVHPSVWIAPGAFVIGDVTLGEQSSVWFGSVIRGDVHRILIGKRTNIQDRSVIHVTHKRFSTTLEDDITVGHSVTLHGCHVASRVLIGMGAIVLDGAHIASDSWVAAGALVPQGMTVPSGVLVMGAPARVKRDLTDAERDFIRQSAQNYVSYQEMYR